ncbi:hypothetical protein [Halobacillus sp. H74]|uniref:hypothetical protein n=1 Tax=Halobacillus sp. H74 TaxID=3457436 RepID=UPI003FCDE385
MNEKIFSLDIGTRSIVGLILEQEDDDFHLLDHLTIEHQERSMLDLANSRYTLGSRYY